MNKQKTFFALSITLIILFMAFSSRILGSVYRIAAGNRLLPLIPLIPRRCDSYGCGNFGAPRDGRARKHKGQDYISTVGQPVFTPIDGRVVSTGAAYADGRYPELTLVKIQSLSGVASFAFMYVLPVVQVGDTVTAGERIGTAQSLQARYPGIPNHVHIELAIGGLKVDPAPFFTTSLKQA